jgi:hypothetical protein
MAKNSETGHAKNVANFESLISVITGWNGVYNPSRQSITVAALLTQAESAKGVLSVANGAWGRCSIAIAARNEGFKPLSSLATRVLNALRSSGTTQQIIGAAQSLVRKIQGKRATPKLTDEEKAALKTDGIEKKEISSSQMSFDNRLENLNKLIELLSGVPQYAPNETDLQVGTLINYYNTLKEVNSAAVAAESQLANARLSRNEILYKPGSGLVDTAAAAKTYAKSLFGARSPQYKQVSGLAFKTIPD